MPAETAPQDTPPFDPTAALTYTCPPHVLELAQDTLSRLSNDASPPTQAFIDRLQGELPVGMGAHKVVYDYKPGQVVALYRWPPDDLGRLRHEFYARKLAHELLPDCIPHVHFAASQPLRMVIDKVEDYTHLSRDVGQETAKTLKQFNSLGFLIDSLSPNFHIDSNGTAVYVDDVWNEKSYHRITREAILDGVIEDLPEDRQAGVLRYMTQLDRLCEIEDQ
ncbi:MAG TPA: hypothetical protein VNG32_04945 [Candidatus Dormibacteraeota bacterium]|nr:hypothetical protein [Candidatus Dormibacteraeota bacterium]